MKKSTPVQNLHAHFRLKSLAVILGILLASCGDRVNNTPRPDNMNTKEIESAVSQRFNELKNYAETGHLDKIFAMYDQSASGSYIDGSLRYKSFKDLFDAYHANWKVSKQDFGNPETKVIVLSPDIALVSSTSKVVGTDSSGTSFDPMQWAITILFTRKDGIWQIHSFHQDASPVVPEEAKKE